MATLVEKYGRVIDFHGLAIKEVMVARDAEGTITLKKEYRLPENMSFEMFSYVIGYISNHVYKQVQLTNPGASDDEFFDSISAAMKELALEVPIEGMAEALLYTTEYWLEKVYKHLNK